MPKRLSVPIDRSNIPLHLLSCPAVKVVCCNSDRDGVRCNVQCRRSGIAEHHNSCPLRVVYCHQGCGCELRGRDEDTHKCLVYLRLQNETLTAASRSFKTEHDTVIKSLNEMCTGLYIIISFTLSEFTCVQIGFSTWSLQLLRCFPEYPSLAPLEATRIRSTAYGIDRRKWHAVNQCTSSEGI